MFTLFDPKYWLIVGPAMLLSLLAGVWVKSAFNHWKNVVTRSGLTGARVAQLILARNGIHDVKVEPAQGFLSDHYDPSEKALRLSPDVYNGRSISALGVAAHEVGHAIQHAQGYSPLGFRSALVPMAQFGSNLSWVFLTIGMVIGAASPLGRGVMLLGVGLFSFAVLFALVTLPVEFDASRRALITLEEGAYLDAEELTGARKILRAAASTYVAGAIMALAQLLYFLLRSGLLGGSRRED